MAELTKQAKHNKEQYESWIETFKTIKKEDIKEYISKEVYKVKITFPFMLAYIKTYDPTDELTKNKEKDNEGNIILHKWFKDNCYSMKPIKERTVKKDKNGEAITKYINGKVVAKTELVETGKTELRKDLPKARKTFLKHYDLDFKKTKFVPKAEGIDWNIEDIL